MSCQSSMPAESGVEDGAGAAGNQRTQADLRVAGGGVLVGALAQTGPVHGTVGHIKVSAVDRDRQHSLPAGATGADR